MQATTAVETEALLDLEQRRCAAIAAADASALRGLLTEDYVHVHATGKIDDLEGHIDAVTSRPRVPERRGMTVRQYGDAAVLVGEQLNRVGYAVSVSVVQQVAIRRDVDWRFVSTQVTRKADQA